MATPPPPDPNQQAAINAITTGLATRAVTVPQLAAVLVTVVGLVFASMAGLSSQIANLAGTVIVVPNRTVTGSAPAATTAADYIVCLNGPTAVQLEAAPTVGTTHVLKDCRPSGGVPITITPTSPDTIDGGGSVTFTFPHQAAGVTYFTGGWQVD